MFLQTFSHFLCLLFPLLHFILIDQPEAKWHTNVTILEPELLGKVLLDFHIMAESFASSTHLCVRTPADSHPDNVLHVKILQWRDVGIVTFVVLQDHLLDNPIQQEPVLHRVTAPLI